jgi:hypothetical protein
MIVVLVDFQGKEEQEEELEGFTGLTDNPKR